MREFQYKIYRWGEPTGDGSNQQFNVAIRAKAKRSAANPFEIANELLCWRLGLALGLPIPMAAVLEHGGETYFASLHPAVAGERLPPALDDDLEKVCENERLACGILVFDAWIMNEDRFEGNISYDYATGHVFLFDHGRAFYDRTGRRYFEQHKGRLCIDAQNHCLAGRVRSLLDFDEWHGRLKAIPEHFIRDSMKMASEVGLPRDDIDFCCDYLIDRGKELKDIFRAEYKVAFPALQPSLFSPFISPEPIDYHI